MNLDREESRNADDSDDDGPPELVESTSHVPTDNAWGRQKDRGGETGNGEAEGQGGEVDQGVKRVPITIITGEFAIADILLWQIYRHVFPKYTFIQ
jgi:hypothetical protein